MRPILIPAALLAAALAPAIAAQGETPKKAVRAAKLTAPPQQQPKSQEQLRAQRAAKLAKPVFENAAWELDYDQARARAKREGKLILVYFTRSYAP